jgi:type II secretory pathway predicted ATPase ExeA
MYDSHFGLRRRPFAAGPDSSRYFPAGSHEQALGSLSQGLEFGEGMVLLTSEPGLGKTMLLHCLVDRLPEGAVPVMLTGARLRDPAALLQAVLFDLGLPYEGRSEQELRLAFVDALLKTFKDGGRTVLLVDEAHHLAPELLEELRLLGNVEAPGGRALQTILAGLPRVLESLRRTGLAALRQRLTVRASLEPFTSEEAVDYVSQAVRGAGGDPDELFTDEARELLAGQTKGVPRLLNQAGHQALLLAWQAGARAVDAEAVHGALESLGLGNETPAGAEAREALEEGPDELLSLGGGPVADVEERPGIAPRRIAVPARPA